MGVDLKWEDENGNVIQEIDDPQNVFARLIRDSFSSETICIQFIDIYGDTTFNRLQIPIFIKELENLIQDSTPTQEKDLVKQIIDLSKKCLVEVHTYIKFYGD